MSRLIVEMVKEEVVRQGKNQEKKEGVDTSRESRLSRFEYYFGSISSHLIHICHMHEASYLCLLASSCLLPHAFQVPTIFACK